MLTGRIASSVKLNASSSPAHSGRVLAGRSVQIATSLLSLGQLETATRAGPLRHRRTTSRRGRYHAPARRQPARSRANAAWEIMTGAAVPRGADAVAMLEHVDATDGCIRLLPKRISNG